MKSEFVMAINQICSERNLPQEVILEAVESALVSAYKRNYGSGQNIKATIDLKTGEPHVFLERIVVENLEDERFEITLQEAIKILPDAEIGTLIQTDVTPRSFGRIAAQTAKQVILQRIREAEREQLFSSYIDREGELINGMVANITAQAVTLNLGRTEAIMPRSQQVPRERYRIGQRVRAYVMEVRKTSRGPQIVVSRTHRHMLRRLLELEVPEIFNGAVEIKGIAREAGSRSKVAVAALQEGVDPVGSCVGIRGMRIQSIVNELGGEKIDVVEWNPDTGRYIANALSPAKVSYALLDDRGSNGKTATVVVPDDQLSLAIGKEGQNARLAAKLTGWRIDIKSLSEASSEDLTPGAAPRAADGPERDILAMAEAILLGKEPPPAAKVEEDAPETAEPEPEAQEPVAEEESVEEAKNVEVSEQEPTVVSQADALLVEQEPELAADEIAEQTAEAAAAEPVLEEMEASIAAQAATEPETEPAAAEQPPEVSVEEEEEEEEELEPQPTAVQARPAIQTKTPRKPRYEYVADENLEALKAKRPSRRKRRRRLVLDEDSGQLISRRKHKRGSDPDDPSSWEEEDF